MSTRNGYRLTEIGQIPKDWKLSVFSAVVEVNPKRSLTVGEEYPFIPMDALSTDSPNAAYVERRVWNHSSGSKFQKGDVLFARITPSAENGKTAIVDTEKGFGSTEFIVLGPKPDGIENSRFLYYAVKFDRIRKQAIQRMTGSTGRQRIPPEAFDDILCPLPPLAEQQKIASILSTVDEASQQTDKIITKSQQLKKGLMQQLLTKGIGHTKFKQTKIGEIPEDWQVVTLDSLIEDGYITYHLDGNHGELYPRENEFVEQGVPFLSANMIINGRMDFSKAKYLNDSRANQLSKGIAQNRDVLLAHNATVGSVTILETDLPKVILGTTLTAYRCNLDKLFNYYLRYYMESSYFQKQLQRIMRQTTRNQVPITAQRKLFFLVPKIDEQRKIASILLSAEQKLKTERQNRQQLEQLRIGLMQVLLTGKVRVKVN
jgi:type I restriction enzyme S subunit